MKTPFDPIAAFLVALQLAIRRDASHWELVRGGKLRCFTQGRDLRYLCCCPVSFLVGLPDREIDEAAYLVGLKPEEAAAIEDAADNRSGLDRTLRKRLLAILRPRKGARSA